MAKKDKTAKSSMNELSMIDRAVQNIFSALDPSYSGKEAINEKDDRIRGILNRELDISKGVSGEHIIDFIASVQSKNEENGKGKEPIDKDKIFTENLNDLYGYYEQVYKNKFIEMKDLQFISKFIPSLGEAVKTQLDSIVASDSISDDINFSFSLPASTSPEDKRAILDEIMRQETPIRLRNKLKNLVYKKTLVSGTHYVYAKSYNDIFREYDTYKKKHDANTAHMAAAQFSTKNKSASESLSLGSISISMESVIADIKSSSQVKTDAEAKKIANEWGTILPHFDCDTSPVLTEALEASGVIGNGVLETFTKEFRRKHGIPDASTMFNTPLATPEATKDSTNLSTSSFDIEGTYIKFIDAKELIPIRVFDITLAYARVQSKTRNMRNTGALGIGKSLFGNLNYTQSKQEEVSQNLANKISDSILQAFDKPFVQKNAEFKDLIAKCILANGLGGDYAIQIIPAEDIIPFRIQEDENGFGTSMLSDSLFHGKALLSLIVCRLLNYFNKTGNRTIAHIHKGPIGSFENNMIDRVLRDLQDNEITFNDLLSTNLTFNKFNKNGNLQMPIARNGNHLVELETLEGQSIDMDPEYEKKLEQMAIVGTGVPTTVMDYDSSADFAKEIVSYHIKHAGRTATLQGDLETPTTELYRKLLSNSSLTGDQKKIVTNGLKVNLPRPKVRTSENTNEFIQNVVSVAGDIAGVIIGQEMLQDTQKNPTAAIMKDHLQFEIVQDMAPFVDWEDYKQKYERIQAEYGSQDPDPANQDNAY